MSKFGADRNNGEGVMGLGSVSGFGFKVGSLRLLMANFQKNFDTIFNALCTGPPHTKFASDRANGLGIMGGLAADLRNFRHFSCYDVTSGEPIALYIGSKNAS